MEVQNMLMEIMVDMGIICPTEDLTEDIDLRDYIYDSIIFISFIVEIESKFNVELGDEFLMYDNLQSMKGFVNLLEAYVKDTAEREELL